MTKFAGKEIGLSRFLTAHGLARNEYPGELVSEEITLKDLFKKD